MLFNSIIYVFASSTAVVHALPFRRQADCAPLQVLYAAGTFEVGLGTTGLALQGAIEKLNPDATVEALDYNTAPEYILSVTAAASDASDILTQKAADCPDAKLAVVGYSKGAMVAHQISVNAEVQQMIVAAATFGDPETEDGGITPPRGDLPVNDLQADVIAFCNDGDPFCDSGPNLAAHLAYLSDGSTDKAAQFIVDRFEAS